MNHIHSHSHGHDHDHEHAHDHAHDHDHDHHHHDDEDPYYVDQLSQIAITAAFGGICLLLYSVRSDMLDLILSTRFSNYVLAGGLILILIAVIRAACLWRESRVQAAGAGDHHH